MAHFAELDKDNVVKKVIVVHNNELLDENGAESEQKGIDFCVNLFGGNWIQTSYNQLFRKVMASVNYTYDATRDAFIRPKANCHDEEILDEETCIWICNNPKHTEVTE